MGTLLKKEVKTEQTPDGTLVTTTMEERTGRSSDGLHYEEHIIESDHCCDGRCKCGWRVMRCRHCYSVVGILRILEIICGFIIIGCIAAPFGGGPYTGILGGQTYVLVVSCLCVVITFILLIIFFFVLYEFVDGVAWRMLDRIYSIIAIILFLIALSVEIWYASGAWRENCNGLHYSSTMLNVCRTHSPWVVAAVCSAIQILLFSLSTFFTFQSQYFI